MAMRFLGLLVEAHISFVLRRYLNLGISTFFCMVLFSNPVTIAQGAPGAPGAPAYLYLAWASDDIGTDFTTTFDPLLDYTAFKISYSVLTPVVGDFAGLWKNYKGTQGAPGTDPIGNVTNVDPTVDDDSSIGYSAGSWWINTVAHKYFVCESSSIGLAVWNLVYPTSVSTTLTEEVPTGDKNGINKTFTIDHTPVGAVAIFYGDVGGCLRMRYGTNFTVSGTTITLITFAPSDANGDVFFASYNCIA